MTTSTTKAIEEIRGQNAPEIILWVIVVLMGAFSAYGMFSLLWHVDKFAYAFTASLFFAISIATPLMVLRAEKAKGSLMALMFVVAAMLAAFDWIAGYNAGIQVESQYMSQTWKDGQAAYDARVSAATTELKDAKSNLQLAIEARSSLVMPDTTQMGPQNTEKETAKFEKQVKAADDLIVLMRGVLADAEKSYQRLPASYVKPQLINHMLLGIVMLLLQLVTLSGFILCSRVKEQRIAAIQSDADRFEREVQKRVKSRVRTAERKAKPKNKAGQTAEPKTHTTSDGQVIYLTAN